MKNTNTLVHLCLIGILTIPLALSQQQTKFSSCASKDRCDECIRTYGCVWCSDPTFKDRRCMKENSDSKCAKNFIMNPTNQIIEVVAKPLSDVTSGGLSGSSDGSSITSQGSSSQENVVQIAPQVVRLKLRPNEGNPFKFKMWYRQALDYPVDLYYLMDLSNSMSDDKEKLSLLGDQLAQAMSNITRNFRLGFGSFVDKVVMPYVSTVPAHLVQPCQSCAAPYGFQNVMPLSTDTSKFAGQVKSAAVSGNLDAPEGGFDAIMQAIVCEQIGWRDKARKLLIFSTDSSFHYAGDGKLGGIVKPNDGCCHLDHRGMYTHSAVQDYPSVSQINMKVKENSINVIFAVTAEQIELYKELGRHVEGSSCGVLSSDSGNVVHLVKDQYDKISSVIEMKDDVMNDMRIKYYTRCLNPNGALVATNKCDGLKVGQTVEFDVELELLSCPADRKDWFRKIHIHPLNMNENLTIEVQMQCDCDCQHPGSESYEENSPLCSNHGTLKCGVCECDPGYSGDDCSCTSDADRTDRCHPNTTTQLCSNRGTCKCNKCYCESVSPTEAFYGDFCQCNNFSCPRIGGKMCSGHGACICGECSCNEGWTSEDCSCENNTTNCVTGPDEVCSGHGKCVCNKCVCDQSGGYSGKYCERCPQCSTKCAELRDCVLCKVHDTGPLKDDKKEGCDCPYTIEIVEFLNVNDDNSFCSYFDDKDCRFTYIYEVRGRETHVIAQKNKECPPQARILGVVFTVILSIVLIGLAFLLMWKFITSMRDRREFAKFEKERMMAKWDTGQNPIYKQATSTFKNPTYCGS